MIGTCGGIVVIFAKSNEHAGARIKTNIMPVTSYATKTPSLCDMGPAAAAGDRVIEENTEDLRSNSW
jgi:hypothetical protein